MPVTIRTFDLGADKHVEGLRRSCARRAQPGAGIARHPLLPGRAAALPHPAARDPARVALRPRPHPGADARVVGRDRPDAAPDRAGEGGAARAERAVQFAGRGRRHDRDSRRRHRDGRVPARSSISCRSAPTISFNTRWRSTARTRPSSHLYDPLHPAVHPAAARSRSAPPTRPEVPIAVCGEMAGEVRDDAACLLGLGLRNYLDASGASADGEAARADLRGRRRQSRTSIGSAAPTIRSRSPRSWRR